MMTSHACTRREMFQRAASAAVGSTMLAWNAEALPPGDVPEPLIIDTHQHLWDLSGIAPAWLEHAPEVYRHSYRPKEYAEATKGRKVQAVYMEVDVEPEKRANETEYVVALCKSKTSATRAAVIGGRPDAPGFDDHIRRFRETGVVRGVRQVLHSTTTPPGTCLTEEFVKGIRLLGKLGLCFDLCMRPGELSDGLKLAELASETRLVIDHCGNADPAAFLPSTGPEKPSHNPDTWKRDMDALGKRPNTICKISGIVASAPEHWTVEQLKPIVDHCLDAFGPDRVVFGGDWPICLKRAALGEWIVALERIIAARPQSERDKLWFENAKAFYAL